MVPSSHTQRARLKPYGVGKLRLVNVNLEFNPHNLHDWKIGKPFRRNES